MDTIRCILRIDVRWVAPLKTHNMQDMTPILQLDDLESRLSLK